MGQWTVFVLFSNCALSNFQSVLNQCAYPTCRTPSSGAPFIAPHFRFSPLALPMRCDAMQWKRKQTRGFFQCISTDLRHPKPNWIRTQLYSLYVGLLPSRPGGWFHLLPLEYRLVHMHFWKKFLPVTVRYRKDSALLIFLNDIVLTDGRIFFYLISSTSYSPQHFYEHVKYEPTPMQSLIENGVQRERERQRRKKEFRLHFYDHLIPFFIPSLPHQLTPSVDPSNLGFGFPFCPLTKNPLCSTRKRGKKKEKRKRKKKDRKKR